MLNAKICKTFDENAIRISELHFSVRLIRYKFELKIKIKSQRQGPHSLRYPGKGQISRRPSM